MLAIRQQAAPAAENMVRSPLDSRERRPHQIGLKRMKSAYRLSLDTLQHAEERRGGKFAKLVDLYTRLGFGTH